MRGRLLVHGVGNHPPGEVLASAAVALANDDHQPEWREFNWSQIAGVVEGRTLSLENIRRTVELVTLGSPLRRLIMRFFPTVLFPRQIQYLEAQMSERLNKFRWVNFFRPLDDISPVSGEPLDRLGMEAVAEGMGHHLVCHHATMPGVGATAEPLASTRRLEDTLHADTFTVAPAPARQRRATTERTRCRTSLKP